MYEKHKRKLMMEQNTEDEIYQRRKKCWLSYGRALLTIGILGLLTILLFFATSGLSNKNDAETHSRVIVTDNNQIELESTSIVESDKTTINDQLNSNKLVKRSVELESEEKRNRNLIDKPKNVAQSLNDVNSDDKDPKLESQQLKPFRRQQGSSSNHPHRHPDGDVYYFKGYKCVPIRKPSKQLELLRARQRLSGMLCCYSSLISCYHLLIVRISSSCNAFVWIESCSCRFSEEFHS